MPINNHVSIVIPVHNEQSNITCLLHEILQCFETLPFHLEIIIVDDGSSDATYSILKALQQKHDQLKIIRHKKNYGQSCALLSGVKEAKYPIVVFIDGDGQNNPADIPKLLDAIHSPHEIAFGVRINRHDNWHRRLSSRVANAIRQCILKDNSKDTGCGLKVFPRQALLDLPHFNHFHRFLPALFSQNGFKIIQVPVSHRPRYFGQSHYGIWNRLFVGIYDLIGVYWLLRRNCHAELADDGQ